MFNLFKNYIQSFFFGKSIWLNYYMYVGNFYLGLFSFLNTLSIHNLGLGFHSSSLSNLFLSLNFVFIDFVVWKFWKFTYVILNFSSFYNVLKIYVNFKYSIKMLNIWKWISPETTNFKFECSLSIIQIQKEVDVPQSLSSRLQNIINWFWFFYCNWHSVFKCLELRY